MAGTDTTAWTSFYKGYVPGYADSSEKSSTMDEKKYDGSTSIWGYVPDSLSGVASVIAAIKGTNTAPVTNVYTPPAQSNTPSGGNFIWYVLGGIALLGVLVWVFKR